MRFGDGLEISRYDMRNILLYLNCWKGRLDCPLKFGYIVHIHVLRHLHPMHSYSSMSRYEGKCVPKAFDTDNTHLQRVLLNVKTKLMQGRLNFVKIVSRNGEQLED